MATSNYIKNVAIVGAASNSGSFMTQALLDTGKHTITALTRADSKGKLPDGVAVKYIDYAQSETMVEALKGQDALVIVLGSTSPNENDRKLFAAAAEAGVSWILPNDWSPDTENEGLVKDVFVFEPKSGNRKAIADLGKSSYISVSTGFWYEWSLAIRDAFGFDFANRNVTFFDKGETKISVSTWPQVGRAVASILSLPIKPEGLNKDACLESIKNRVVYVNSFTVCQKEMLASALRVTGTKESDWTITKEPAQERYTTGVKEMKEGDRIGFLKMLYTRVFYPDGSGDTEHGKGTINALLGLPKEDFDEATERAIERSKGPQWT